MTQKQFDARKNQLVFEKLYVERNALRAEYARIQLLGVCATTAQRLWFRHIPGELSRLDARLAAL